MMRWPVLLLLLLPLAYANVCLELPLLQVSPAYVSGTAGTLQETMLIINNTKFGIFCPTVFSTFTDVPSVALRYDPAGNTTNVTAQPNNHTGNKTFVFSTLANTTPGNYTVVFKVTSRDFEGVPTEVTVPFIIGVTAPSLNQPDLTITAAGFHCFDRTNIPRSACFLYDFFSLDNVTVKNVGTRDYNENASLEASNEGPNITATFAGAIAARIPAGSSVVVPFKKGITSFAIAAMHTIRIKINPTQVTPEISLANNEFILSMPISDGYPPGCFYNNPSCGLGFTCRDNQCVALAVPSLLPADTPTPTPDVSASPTPLPVINLTEIEELRNQSIASGQNDSEVDRLLNESLSLHREGRFAQALEKIEEAKKRVNDYTAKVRASTNISFYLYASLGFLFLLLLLIAVLVVRKRKHEEGLKPAELDALADHPKLETPQLELPQKIALKEPDVESASNISQSTQNSGPADASSPAPKNQQPRPEL